MRARVGVNSGERSAGWAGLAFVALAAVWGVVQVAVSPPELSGASTTEITSFYGEQSNRISLMLAALSLVLAGFALLWFLGGLRSVLRRAEGDDGTLTTVAVLAGGVLVALLCVFNTLQVAFAWALEESDDFRLDPDSVRLFEGLTYLLAIHATFVGAAFVWASSRLFRQAASYPTWLVRSGLVIAVLSFLLAVPFHGVPLVLLLPWVLVVSLRMLGDREGKRA